jgi:cell division protein FtsA
MKSAKKSSDFFKGLIDKTKGLLMDDFSDKNDY